jgi:hypothetical protein
MKKTMMIMIIGAVVIGMGFSASAEEDILPERMNEEASVEGEELLIAPNPDSEEPLVIAPSPTDEGDVDTQISENQESGELVDATGSYATTAKETNSEKLDIGVQAVIIAGTVFVLLMTLLFLKRKK